MPIGKCIGKRTTAWIEDWNRLRRGADAVNRIEVIELRTDPKYGKFISHLERLSQQAGLLKPRIEDWRAMVDSVMIDPTYDGEVFTVGVSGVSDVPEKKTDLVIGTYDIPCPSEETTVAVKITDMLGEEVLVVERV